MKALLLALALSVACTKSVPCDVLQEENHYFESCSKRASLGFCGCAWRYFAERHTCEELRGGVSEQEKLGAIEACKGHF